MAERTIGAVLGEAADANERSMEGSRRAALTNVQLKGEVENQKWTNEQRDRSRAYLKDLQAAYDEKMFDTETVPSQQPQAIPDGTPGTVFPGEQTVKKPIDPGSKRGIERIAELRMIDFGLRVKHGLVQPEEYSQIIDFRKKMDSMGVTDELQAAIRGDANAAVSFGEHVGIKGVQGIQSGVDENGFLDVYAIVANPDGSARKVSIGHWAAAFSPEIASAVKNSAEKVGAVDALRTNENSRRNQTRQANAAETSAAASMLRARNEQEALNDRTTAMVARGEQQRVFADIQKGTDYELPGFTSQMPGSKPTPMPDDSGKRLVDQIGMVYIEDYGLMAGQAHNRALSLLGQANTQAAQSFKVFKDDILSAHNLLKQGKPATLGGATITPDNKAEVAKINSLRIDLSRGVSSAQLYQGMRDNIVQRELDKLRSGSTQAAPAAAPAKPAAIPRQ